MMKKSSQNIFKSEKSKIMLNNNYENNKNDQTIMREEE